jgi:hypothetical protein
MDSVSPLRKKLIIYFIGFTAALAGLLFGLDVGVISGALPYLKNEFKLECFFVSGGVVPFYRTGFTSKPFLSDGGAKHHVQNGRGPEGSAIPYKKKGSTLLLRS